MKRIIGWGLLLGTLIGMLVISILILLNAIDKYESMNGEPYV